MNNILVTGAGGYIGSILVPYLLRKGFRVNALDRYFFGSTLKKHKNLKLIIEDIRSINKKYFKNIDVVIDLVAISNDPAGEIFSKETNQINFKCRVNNCKIAKMMGIKRYILPSTCSVYGYQKNTVNENSKTTPISNYAIANLEAENKVLKLADKNFSVTVVRQATVFGYSPRMRFDLVINSMIYDAIKLNTIFVSGDGKQIRPFIHVKDVCRFFYYLIKIDNDLINGQILNLGNDKLNLSIGKLAKIIRSKINNKCKISKIGKIDERSYRVNFEKIKKLKFNCIYSIDEAIKDITNRVIKNKIVKNNYTETLKWYQCLEEVKDVLKFQNKYNYFIKK